MTTLAFFPNGASPRRITLAEIDAAESARLGPTRVAGKAQPACFNRQIAMYLAKHVGRWSTTVIGRFYNGRDHSTVCHGIQRIEFLRDSNPDVDALVTELKRQLALNGLEESCNQVTNENAVTLNRSEVGVEEFADLVAERVCAYLEKRLGDLFLY